MTGCSHPESFFNKFTSDNKVTYLCIQRGNITNLNCIIDLQSLNILRLISISKLENFDGIEKLSRSLSFLEIDSIKNKPDLSKKAKEKVYSTYNTDKIWPQLLNLWR